MAKILLVDADQDNSRNVHKVLGTQGHTVVPARSAEDALNILHSDSTIRLILTAQVLPDTTGFKFVQQLAAEPQLQKIPVVMLLAQVDEITLRAGLHVGVKDFLARPWEPETLINKVKRNLPRRKAVVLIIEYERIICDRLKYIIELKEFTVLLAGTAEEGLEILRNRRVDVVIADIGLPEMPGPVRMKARPPLASTINSTPFP
jgi:DNA-binding response OmpR family regulator